MKTPRIVLLGGGTGSFTLLQGLKALTPHLTAIVNMSDDGGSTGVLRDELGVLPPGDVRQCLVALSDNPDVRDLFSYRFSDGRFEGQSLGNIILSGLELRHDSFEKAVQVAGGLLQITGRVVPVTLEKHTLAMRDGDEVMYGESQIGEHVIQQSDAAVWLEPAAAVNPAAVAAIRAADLIVVAPGNLYASILPILSVDGVAAALRDTKALVVSVSNLVNKPAQTLNWHVADYVERLEASIGAPRIDVALYNDDHISPQLLEKYAADGEFPVRTDATGFAGLHAKPIGVPLVSREITRQDPADTAIQRTLIRHDASAVCRELKHLLAQRLAVIED